MTVDAEARSIVRRAMKTPKRKHGDYPRCIYCGIVVGEVVQVNDELEYERCVKTVKGPVCESCMRDPTAKARAELGVVQDERRKVYRAQSKRGLTGAEREERDAEIVRMHDKGMTYTEIAPLMVMSKQGVATAARRRRDRGRHR